MFECFYNMLWREFGFFFLPFEKFKKKKKKEVKRLKREDWIL